MSSDTKAEVRALAEQVRDTNRPVDERRKALKLIAELRGEPGYLDVGRIPEEDLIYVIGAATAWQEIGVTGLTVRSAAEAVAEARLERAMRVQRKPSLV